MFVWWWGETWKIRIETSGLDLHGGVRMEARSAMGCIWACMGPPPSPSAGRIHWARAAYEPAVGLSAKYNARHCASIDPIFWILIYRQKKAKIVMEFVDYSTRLSRSLNKKAIDWLEFQWPVSLVMW